MPDRPRYMISVAAELAGLHPQTLRMYEARGLVRPARTPGGTRLYSELDVERLRLVQRLTTELGLNLAGVTHVLRLEDELRRMRARMEQLEHELRDEIQLTHKQYRREMVVYRTAASRDDILRSDMDFNKLTIKSGEAVAGAQELARRAGNPEITPDHLAIALLDQELPRTLVERAGANPAALRSEAETRLAQQPSVSGGAAASGVRRVPQGPRRRARRGHARSRTSTSPSSISSWRSRSSRATRSSRRCSRSAAASA